MVPLRDLILDSQNGLSKRSGTDGVETPVLRLADITAGKIDESDPREIRLTAKELAKYALQHGDLVCIRVNGSKALVGRVIQFRANRAWAYCDHFIRLRPNQAIVDHRYLAHYFNSQTVRRHIELNMVSSAGQNTVSQGTMLDIPVPCPGLETQREIVAELEKQFSRLDEAVANLQRVKANLKRYKASVLKAAVEGRLVETEASLAHREGRTYETGEQLLQRILEERRTLAKGKRSVLTQPDLDDLEVSPEGWAWSTCDAAIDGISAGASFKCDERPPVEGEIGVLKVSALTWGAYDEDESKTCKNVERIEKKFLVRDGDFLFSRANTIELVGACVIVGKVTKQLMLSDKTLRFELNSRVLPAWLQICLRCKFGRDEIERLATGNQESMRNIGQDRIRQIRMPLPPLAEQVRIVAEVDRHLSIAREVEAEVDTNLKRAQALRQATLARAFSVTGG